MNRLAIAVLLFVVPLCAAAESPSVSGVQRLKNSILGRVGFPLAELANVNEAPRFHVLSADSDSDLIAGTMGALYELMPLDQDNANTVAAIGAAHGQAFSVGPTGGATFHWTARNMPTAETRAAAVSLSVPGAGESVDDSLLRAALWCPMSGAASAMETRERLALLGACKRLAETIVDRGFDQLPPRDALAALSSADLAAAWSYGEGNSGLITLISYEAVR